MAVFLCEEDYPIEWLHGAVAAKIVGMDIETSGLDRVRDKIATIQMFVPNMGTIMLRKQSTNPTVLLKLLEHKQITKIFHHAPFDLGFLMRDYKVFPEKIADTKVAAKILDPRRISYIHPDTHKGSHALLSLVFHYFGEKLDKTLAVSDWFANDLSEEQLTYAAKDVEYLPALLYNLERALAKQGKVKLARKAMNNIPTKIALELNGMPDIYDY